MSSYRQTTIAGMKSATVDAPLVTKIHIERMCDCPFAIAQEYAVEYLQKAEAGGAEAMMHSPLPVLQRRVQMSFGLSADITETGRSHEEIVLLWSSGSKLFPNFRGTIRFRIDRRSTVVLVDGSYKPPFGWLGVTFDTILGRWIARRTIADLARRVCDHLERREREWRDHLPVENGAAG